MEPAHSPLISRVIPTLSPFPYSRGFALEEDQPEIPAESSGHRASRSRWVATGLTTRG
jgi:hypothetical protein